jgi:hypothetical protein
VLEFRVLGFRGPPDSGIILSLTPEVRRVYTLSNKTEVNTIPLFAPSRILERNAKENTYFKSSSLSVYPEGFRV